MSDLSFRHRRMFETVVEHGPLTSAEIARKAGFDVHEVGVKMRQLFVRGYIEKAPGQRWAEGELPYPEVTDREAILAVRAKLWDKAVAANLRPQRSPTDQWRISVPHPLGKPGRVWIDTPGDLEAVLLDRGRHTADAWESRHAA